MVKYQASRMDRTFSALADPTRRAVLLRLKEKPGLSVSELARPFSLKLPGMMKHLDVLSDAGLITRSKAGRNRVGQSFGRADAGGDGVAQTV